MHAPEPDQTGVSTREAAAILGTSVSDVLRRIRQGRLRAEKFERNGGTYFRVYLDPPQTTSEPRQPIESEAAPEPRQDVSAAITAAVAPYVAMNERIAELYQGAVEQIAALEREAGAATTRAELLQVELDLVRRGWLRRLKDALW